MMLVLKFNQEMDIFYKSLSLYRKGHKAEDSGDGCVAAGPSCHAGQMGPRSCLRRPIIGIAAARRNVIRCRKSIS